MERKIVCVRLDDDILYAINKICDMTGLDRSETIRRMLRIMIKLTSPDTRFIDIIKPYGELMGVMKHG